MKYLPFPTKQEQEEVRKYVIERPLVRPKTNIKTIIISILVFVFAITIIGLAILWILNLTSLTKIITEHISYNLFIVLMYLSVFLIALILCFKMALIGLIKCYQHYASETRRRRCLCKPTCSEYAIIVLKKYGVIRGVFKIRRRLFVVCRGNVFHIDEP